MIHVVAQQVAAAAQFDERHGVGVVGRDEGAPVVGRCHAAAQFAGEIGIVGVAPGHLLLLPSEHVGADGGGAAEGLEVEGLVVVAHTLIDVFVPEAVGVVAVEGQHLTEGHRRGELGPSRAGVEGQVEADGERDALEVEQIFGGAAIFVVELGRDDRAAVFPLKALHLGVDLAVEARGEIEENAVARAHLAALGEEPVGQAAVAHLAVAPGAHAQDDGHSLVAAHLEEAAQVALSAPVEAVLLLLDVVPEDVGGDECDAALAHLAHLTRPFGGGQAAVVYLAHHGAKALAVDDEAMAVPGDGAPEERPGA